MPAVNYLAVVVSAVAVFVIGMLWYSPLILGKQWSKAHGHTPEKLAELKKRSGNAYAVSLVCSLVMGVVLALLITQTGAATPLEGAELGAMLWLGFAATIGLTANMFSEKRLAVFFIDTGYQLVYLIAMGAILAAWP